MRTNDEALQCYQLRAVTEWDATEGHQCSRQSQGRHAGSAAGCRSRPRRSVSGDTAAARALAGVIASWPSS